VGLARNGGAAFDGRLDAAQAGGMADDLHRSADGVGGLRPALDVERHHGPKPAMTLRAVACAGWSGYANPAATAATFTLVVLEAA
jgi:hypothetical protein